MYVARVPNRASPPAILLRESFREGAKVKTRTLANLSHWPAPRVEALKRVLKGEALAPLAEAFTIERSLPHGHVAAVLGTLARSGLAGMLARGAERLKRLSLALIAARVIEPASKLATARSLDAGTASSSLGAVLALAEVDEDALYAALDWLGAQQARIESRLAKRHLGDGTLVLYDVSSTYFEGRCCPLARFGYSRDKRSDRLQIVFGVLCSGDGCPIAVEVFAGDTADPKTLAAQVDKVRHRFGLARVALVGDRGMITEARIREDLEPAGLDWITSLRAPQVQALAQAGGPLQLSLFDERDLAEITSPDYPGERLIVCRNPALAEERRRKREELLAAAEKKLSKIAAATRRPRAPLVGRERIGLKAGAALAASPVAKHFKLTIADDGFAFAREQAKIAAEAALDGLYVIRTSLPAAALAAEDAVGAYKSLAHVEGAFRSLKGLDIQVRPIFHWTAARVRAHVFLCLLSLHLEWHLRRALAPILFDDHDKAAALAARPSPVAKAQPSEAARRKAHAKRTDDGWPVHSFRSLLADLATLTRNSVRFAGDATATLLARPTPIQQKAFDLLGVRLAP